jgi:F-type H+-transporting ATPase subunit epsilon
MRLRIVSPLVVLVDEDIDSLRAEDASGSFSVLNGHAPFLTALTVSILSWRQPEKERFCAVRGGALTVTGGTDVAITTREGVTGDNLATLDAEVLALFRKQADAERVDHIETVQLQLNAIRRMVSRLHAHANAGEFR